MKAAFRQRNSSKLNLFKWENVQIKNRAIDDVLCALKGYFLSLAFWGKCEFQGINFTNFFRISKIFGQMLNVSFGFPQIRVDASAKQNTRWTRYNIQGEHTTLLLWLLRHLTIILIHILNYRNGQKNLYHYIILVLKLASKISDI